MNVRNNDEVEMQNKKKVITIEFIFDPICPWCFLGYKRLQKAIQQITKTDSNLSFRIVWRSFISYPKLSERAKIDDIYTLLYGSPQRWEKVKEIVTTEARKENLEFTFRGYFGNTFDAHRLMLWSLQFDKQTPLAEKLFEEYFLKNQNIGDRNVLIKICDDIGIEGSKEFLESEECKTEVESQFMMYKSKGVRSGSLPQFSLGEEFVE